MCECRTCLRITKRPGMPRFQVFQGGLQAVFARAPNRWPSTLEEQPTNRTGLSARLRQDRCPVRLTHPRVIETHPANRTGPPARHHQGGQRPVSLARRRNFRLADRMHSATGFDGVKTELPRHAVSISGPQFIRRLRPSPKMLPACCRASVSEIPGIHSPLSLFQNRFRETWAPSIHFECNRVQQQNFVFVRFSDVLLPRNMTLQNAFLTRIHRSETHVYAVVAQVSNMDL